ncbi:hypothetical protein LXA43DRAFT_1083404 [Ganoderma leucocontextum]|nr:hypothetical protein LXA43DRAFT_1083404 [Ganoderma leucocontextum]
MSSSLEHPFNDPSADVILASSDNVVFKLHKIILSLGSEFFKDMLCPSCNEPQTNDSTLDAEIDGLPVIHVSEPSRVLDKLFRLCYPLDDPPLETIDEVAALLTAALKYDLRKPIQMTSRRLRELMTTASLRVYAIACKLELEDEARAAAVVIREQKLQNEYVGELEDISIGAYHRLLYFCETGNDPGGLFFTGRPMRRVNKNKEKPKRAGMGSVSATPPEPSSAAFAPLVAHPFNIANPDVIIQASDGVAFGFSKSFIELASPILFNMGRDCPIPSTIQIPESSGIVSILFYICATKYGMQKAVQFLQAALVKQTDVPSTDPFLLYTIACHHDMRDLALRAAKRTLRTELTNTLRPEVEAIDIPAGYLYRLLEYHRRCYDAIRTIFASHSWIGNDWYSCLLIHCRRLYYNGNLPCWYSRYMTEVGRESWPGPVSAVKDAALKAGFATSDTNCGPCIQNGGAVQLVKFTEYVAETMTRLENEVILEWPSHADPSPST